MWVVILHRNEESADLIATVETVMVAIDYKQAVAVALRLAAANGIVDGCEPDDRDGQPVAWTVEGDLRHHGAAYTGGWRVTIRRAFAAGSRFAAKTKGVAS